MVSFDFGKEEIRFAVDLRILKLGIGFGPRLG